MGNYRLRRLHSVVTLEPCLMCTGAIVHARLAGVVYGAADNKAGAVESCFNGLDLTFHNHRVWHMGGIAAPECASYCKIFQKADNAVSLFPFKFLTDCITLSCDLPFSWTNGVYRANFKRRNTYESYSIFSASPEACAPSPAIRGSSVRQAMPSPTVNFQIADPPMFLFTMPIIVIPNLNQYKR